MHESVIALGIVREIDKHVKSSGPPARIRVVLGELQNVDEVVLGEYMKMYLEEQGLSEVDYVFEWEKAHFRCSACGYEWSLDELGLTDSERESIHFLPEAVYAIIKCPKCGSRVYDVLSGRGVRIVIEEKAR
jgi:hydrogenase nickel incorporation protein HypA/HybF